jgi:ribosomal protein S18 acetylase RimI-like enzyme
MVGAVEPWAHGSVLRTPLAPDYWDVNLVRVEGDDPGLTPAWLLEVVEVLQEGLRHRKIEVEDEGFGERLQDPLRAAGWVTDRLAFMQRSGPPPAEAGSGVVEVDFPETRALRLEWHDSDAWGQEEALHLESQEVVAARSGTRAFAVREGGALVGYAALQPGEGAAEVTELFVSASHRGTGLGARLVAGALAAGGQDSNWIVADEDGRPKRLYERLGFRAVWRLHTFTRLPE